MTAKPLQLVDVSQRYDAVTVFEQLNMEVEHHEFLAVVGPSGCGKTTLLNLLSGFLKPSSGKVIRNGKMRMIYQQGGLFPWLTAGENILLGLEHLSDAGERRRQLDELLDMIRLSDFKDHYPHQLSGGMRQRVEIARALAGETDILLMDEPFSALDYLTRLRMRLELERLLGQRPRSVVFVTHDIEEAAQMADRVVVLSERPARITGELRLTATRPRSPTDPEVVETVRRLLLELGPSADNGEA